MRKVRDIFPYISVQLVLFATRGQPLLAIKRLQISSTSVNTVYNMDFSCVMLMRANVASRRDIQAEESLFFFSVHEVATKTAARNFYFT